MKKVGNKMDNKSDEQFLVVQDEIDVNKQETEKKEINTDEKLTHITEDLKVLTATITSIMDQNKNSKFSPAQKNTSNPPYPTTVVPYNRKFPPLDGRNSTKICGMWTLKHEIISQKIL